MVYFMLFELGYNYDSSHEWSWFESCITVDLNQIEQSQIGKSEKFVIWVMCKVWFKSNREMATMTCVIQIKCNLWFESQCCMIRIKCTMWFESQTLEFSYSHLFDLIRVITCEWFESHIRNIKFSSFSK